MDITDLLTAAVEAEASDLHLKSGNYPMMRVHGELRPIVEDCRLSPTAMDALAAELLPAARQPRLAREHEVEVDTASFAQALRSALRQDPDVILVGEMRDLETAETELTAAETGHLVMSTVHTLDATETINRLIAVFPPHQHRQIRLRLASVLRAVISQRLMPRIDGTGRSAAVEVLVSTPFVRDCIVDPDRTHLIQGAIAAETSHTGCKRSTNRSTGCIRAARSPTTRRFRRRAARTNSSCAFRV